MRALLRSLYGGPHESGWVNYAPYLGRLRFWFCEKPATAAQKAKPEPGKDIRMYPDAVALDGEMPYGEVALDSPALD